MKHLSNEQLLIAAEGGAERPPHLAACDSCRVRVEELRRVLSLASSVDVPEPSPLFWNHFSDRVREVVATEPPSQPAVWRFYFGRAASLVAAVAIVVIGAAIAMRTSQPANTMMPATAEVATLDGNLSALDDDPNWAVMGEVAAQMDWEDATEAGLASTAPGAAERALAQMSVAEQRQVVELLQMELQKSKSL